MSTAPASRALFALWLLAAGAPAAGAELGTLFHTAEERERLDRLRRGEADVGFVARSGAPVVTGYVKRSDGRTTVWIDGTAVNVSNPDAAAILESKAARTQGRSAEDVRIERKPAR